MITAQCMDEIITGDIQRDQERDGHLAEAAPVEVEVQGHQEHQSLLKSFCCWIRM